MRAQYCRCCGWPARATQCAIATAAHFHSNPQLLGSVRYLRCERGFKEITIYAYRRHLNEFAEYLSQAGVTSFSELSPPLLAAFIVDRAPGMAPRTRRDLCGHLRVLLRFCHRKGVTNRDLGGAVGMSQVDRLQKSYAARAAIEGTHAQAIRRSGLRRTRYRGLPKTHLQHVITAAAINLLRIAAWANGTPIAQTRCSPLRSSPVPHIVNSPPVSMLGLPLIEIRLSGQPGRPFRSVCSHSTSQCRLLNHECAVSRNRPLSQLLMERAQVDPDTSEEKHSYEATKSAEQEQDKHLTTP